MNKNPIATLLGGKERLKIIRLFVNNPDVAFDIELVSQKSGEPANIVRKNIELLTLIGLIVSHKLTKTVEKKKAGKVFISKVKVPGFVLNKSFEYLKALSEFLVQTAFIGNEEIEKRLRSVGKLKLIVVAGIFIQDPESRLDIFVVGNGIRKNALDRAIKGLEAELGRELKYSAFETTDFKYRMDMYDKLVRDVIDYPHRIVIDKIGIESK